jgi:predicted AlkP superfamily pyrophosphatase or phosphodiesterase
MTAVKSALRPATAILVILAAFLANGCRVANRAEGPPPPLLLVSMDGFRWDYPALHPAETPTIHELIRTGISASEMIPVYPSNTFPNHYAIATGLYPAHNGIVNNDMFDPKFGAVFQYTLPVDNGDGRWWGGEPIWVTAVKQGRKSAANYWVGSEAPIEGIRPTYFKPFQMAVYQKQSFDDRIDEIVGWLKLPPDQRPAIVTCYLEETNSVGHKFGPDSKEIVSAVRMLDARLGALLARLKAEHIPVNVVLVSDHGMTNVSPDRVMVIDDYVDLRTVQVDFQSPAVGLRPLQGTAQDLVRALAKLPHAKAYLTDNQPPPPGLAGVGHWLSVNVLHRGEYLPARFHLTNNLRIPDVWIVPEEGWHVQTRATSKVPAVHDQKGDHGFDPAFRSMRSILIANGPSFKDTGEVIGPVPNIDVYNLLCAALRLTPAPNDGDDRLVRAFLR